MAPRRSSRLVLALLTLPVLTACNLAVSLDELRSGGGSSAGGSGGVAAGGSTATGDGGAGGMSTGDGSDWTGAFDAVWKFEQPSPNLGLNSGFGNSGDLLEVGLPSRNTIEAKQGTSSLELTDTHRLSSNEALFHVGAGDSFTFGGWFKRDTATLSATMGKMGSGNPGYLFESLDGNTAKCFLADSTQAYLAQAPEDSWLPGSWTHFACRYDAAAGELTIVIDGVLGTSLAASLEPSPAPFSISDAISPYAGLVDEAFFVRSALSYSSLARIHACGIDGAECSCSESDPSTYDNCGRADPGCGSLPACNLANP